MGDSGAVGPAVTPQILPGGLSHISPAHVFAPARSRDTKYIGFVSQAWPLGVSTDQALGTATQVCCMEESQLQAPVHPGTRQSARHLFSAPRPGQTHSPLVVARAATANAGCTQALWVTHVSCTFSDSPSAGREPLVWYHSLVAAVPPPPCLWWSRDARQHPQSAQDLSEAWSQASVWEAPWGPAG